MCIRDSIQAKLMFDQQPLKMAAAEAACESGTGFSVLAIGNLSATNCDEVVGIIEVPGLLSFLANGDFTTEVQGVNDLVPQYQEQYGTNLPDDPKLGARAGMEINYVPVMAVTYWGFRLMIGFGGLAAIAAVVALWITRKGTVPQSKWLMRLALLGILAPFAASAAGWVFTEMGRQPFVVAPNPTPGGIDGVFMFTASAVSPGVEPWEMIVSLVALTLVYLALLVVEVGLLWKYARAGVAGVMPELAESHDDTDKTDDVLAFAY